MRSQHHSEARSHSKKKIIFFFFWCSLRSETDLILDFNLVFVEFVCTVFVTFFFFFFFFAFELNSHGGPNEKIKIRIF